MNIRTRLTLIFFVIVIVVQAIICGSIYFFSAEYRKVDFYRRIKNRAINTARILMEVKEVNADLLRRLERNNPASLPDQHIVIYNSNNELLYSSDGTAKESTSASFLNEIRQKREIKLRETDYEIVGFIFKEGDQVLTIVGRARDVYGTDALKNLRGILLITLAVATVIVSILGWIYAGRVLKPISNIVSEVSNITEANLSERVRTKNDHDELGRLAATFNDMLQRLENAFTSQKSFIANASHEIKTPITVMSGEIEVTLLQEREKLYYVTILKSVLKGLKGLNRLTTQLLVLAQTSATDSNKKFSSLRFDDLLWECKDELTKISPDYNVDILFDIQVNHESLEIRADEQLLKIALLNLMDNGCKYSPDKRVVIDIHGTEHKIVTRFSNTGSGISSEIQEKIFDPFFRANNNKSVRGFGIGLSLVKRIVDVHHGEIRVESIPHQLTTFTIVLPVDS